MASVRELVQKEQEGPRGRVQQFLDSRSAKERAEWEEVLADLSVSRGAIARAMSRVDDSDAPITRSHVRNWRESNVDLR